MTNKPFKGSYRPAPEPKPFGKVVITRDKARNKIIRHDRFMRDSYTGKMDCVLTARTPLHVGSGVYELVNDNPVRGLITADGKVIVPGTSLKGVIRSIAEAISDSCLRIVRDDIKKNLSVPGARPCDLSASEKGHAPHLCVCCSIFGALGYQGRVSFTDARLKGGTAIHSIQSPYPPRDSARFYKDAKRRFNGRKFYYHGLPVNVPRGEPYQVITPNSELEFTAHFENLTAPEFCLLLVAMGILDDIIIKLGGAKQAMLGSVEIIPTCLDLQDVEASFKDFSGGESAIKKDIINYLIAKVGQASHLINQDALDELMKIWAWPSNRKAPTGIY